MEILLYILFFAGLIVIWLRSSQIDPQDLKRIIDVLTVWCYDLSISFTEKVHFIDSIKQMNTGELIYLYNYVYFYRMRKRQLPTNSSLYKSVKKICKKYNLYTVLQFEQQ